MVFVYLILASQMHDEDLVILWYWQNESRKHVLLFTNQSDWSTSVVFV